MHGRNIAPEIPEPKKPADIGLYIGLVGVFLSFVGVILSIYALVAGEKAIWLGLSGWLSALLIGVFLSIPLSKSLREISRQHSENIALINQLIELKTANSKIIEIDAYVISKAVRQPVKRERKQAEPSKARHSETDTEATENMELVD